MGELSKSSRRKTLGMQLLTVSLLLVSLSLLISSCSHRKDIDATIKETEEQNRVLRDRLQRLEEAAARKLKEDAVHGPEKSN